MGATMHEDHYGILNATLSPAQVSANTTAEQAFTLPTFSGLRVSDFIVPQKPTAQAGLGIVGARVSAPGVISITFSNNTASGITPTAAEVYALFWFRPEKVLARG